MLNAKNKMMNGTDSKIILLNPITQRKMHVLRVERCQQKRLRSVGIWPPISLLESALYLRQRGFQNVEVIDGEVESLSFNKLVQTVAQRKPDMVVMHTTTPTMGDDIVCARRLKEYVPHISIVFTGLHVSLLPQLILKEDSIDYVVKGEPEETVSELAAVLFRQEGQLRNVKGLGFKADKTMIINDERSARNNYDYPHVPDRSLIKNDRYVLPLTGTIFTVIKVSRGCDFSCTFCTAESYYGRGWHARSVDNIIEEIKDCTARYGIDTFLFLSDTFNARKDFIVLLCNRIVNEQLNIRWVANSRIDLVDDELCGAMKRAGCMLVSLGIESYNKNVLEKNNKHCKVDNINKNIRLFKRVGILTYGYFIFGLNGQTVRTIMSSIIRAWLSPLDYARFYTMTPYPGTEYYEQYKSEHPYDYFHGSGHIRTCAHVPAFIIACLKTFAVLLFYCTPRRILLLVRYCLRQKLC